MYPGRLYPHDGAAPQQLPENPLLVAPGLPQGRGPAPCQAGPPPRVALVQQQMMGAPEATMACGLQPSYATSAPPMPPVTVHQSTPGQLPFGPMPLQPPGPPVNHDLRTAQQAHVLGGWPSVPPASGYSGACSVSTMGDMHGGQFRPMPNPLSWTSGMPDGGAHAAMRSSSGRRITQNPMQPNAMVPFASSSSSSYEQQEQREQPAVLYKQPAPWRGTRLVHCMPISENELVHVLSKIPKADVLVVTSTHIEPTVLSGQMRAMGWTMLVYGSNIVHLVQEVASAVCIRRQSDLFLKGCKVKDRCCTADLVHGATHLHVAAAHVPIESSGSEVTEIGEMLIEPGSHGMAIVVGCISPGAPRTFIETIARTSQYREVRPLSDAATQLSPSFALVSSATVCGIDRMTDIDSAHPVLFLSLSPGARSTPALTTLGTSSTASRGDSNRGYNRMRSCKVTRLERALRARFALRHEYRQKGGTEMVTAINKEISDIRRKLEVLKKDEASVKYRPFSSRVS